MSAFYIFNSVSWWRISERLPAYLYTPFCFNLRPLLTSTQMDHTSLYQKACVFDSGVLSESLRFCLIVVGLRRCEYVTRLLSCLSSIPSLLTSNWEVNWSKALTKTTACLPLVAVMTYLLLTARLYRPRRPCPWYRLLHLTILLKKCHLPRWISSCKTCVPLQNQICVHCQVILVPLLLYVLHILSDMLMDILDTMNPVVEA